MLDNLKEQMYSFAIISNKWKLLYIIVTLALFIGLAYYVFSIFVEPRYSSMYTQNKEFIYKDAEPNYNIDIYLIYTTWCPHCKEIIKSGGEWENIRERWNGKTLKEKYKVNFKQIDGDNAKEVKEFELKYLNGNEDKDDKDIVKIESYPTIYLIKNNQVIEFDANPTLDRFTNFLESVV